MSGRSGYGRSRIVGKLIHLPANMNMAGLAPRVGKPGWAIRLYYQRVDECFCCIPIKITRRIFVTGNSITNASLTGTLGLLPSVTLLSGASPSPASQAFYGIVFDRKIEIAGASDPATAEFIPLHQVNVAGTDTLITTLTNNDFKKISSSQAWGPVGTQFNINIGDKTTVGTNWTTVNQIGGGVSSQLFGSTVGTLSAAYVVTNPNKLGGYALLFNMTQILNSSRANANNNTAAISITNSVQQQQFRSNLLAMTTGGNNISTTYTPGRLTTPEPCIPGSLTVSAPVGSFSIADTTGQPPLELLA